MKKLIVFALTAALSCATVSAQSPADRSKSLNALFTEIWEDTLRHSPEFASSLGDRRYNDQLSDASVAAYNQRLARGRDYLMRLSAIDDSGLSDQDKLGRLLLIHQLIEEQQESVFKPWEQPVNQFNGPHSSLPRLVALVPLDTVKDYEDWIARLKKMPVTFQQTTDNMFIGMEDKRVPPRFLLEKVLTQVNGIAAMKPEDTPFAQPLKKFPATFSAEDKQRLTAAMLETIQKQVLPAYQRFGRFLEKQYIPAGRADAGVWALPEGDAYYAFRVKQSTTTDLTPDQIHQIGLTEVKRDEEQMLAIAKKLGFADLKSFQASIAKNPKLHPASREQLLDAYRHTIDQMRPRLPELFGRLPKAPLAVEPVPAFIEKNQAAAYYEPGTPDGSRPGRIMINTYNFADRSLADVEAIAYHEGLPGHHLQIAIAQELQGMPEFRKHTYFTAYTEGWGLYAERLGKDIGFYQDPYSEYGRLEADIWRAIRLVVDTGVHSRHWTRDQMVQYFRDHSAIDETNIQSEVDRYIAWPGQALGYKIGQLKYLELRERAQKELGKQFDLRAFHDVVLGAGALPLDLLDQRVTDWIATQKPVTSSPSSAPAAAQ